MHTSRADNTNQACRTWVKYFHKNLHFFEQSQSDLRTKQYLNDLLDKEIRHEIWFKI